MIAAFNLFFPEETSIKKACIKFSGIGKKMAGQALDRAGITKDIEIGALSSSQLSRIQSIIEHSYLVDNELRASIRKKIDRLSSTSSFRGRRHFMGLPCRGQRTHSNARTCRRLKRK